MYKGSSDLLPVVLEETGGLGVDIIIDSGGKHVLNCQRALRLHAVNLTPGRFSVCLCVVRLQEEQEESEETKLLPHKHDIISVLGVGGHWVTSHKDLQVTHHQTYKLHLFTASVLNSDLVSLHVWFPGDLENTQN